MNMGEEEESNDCFREDSSTVRFWPEADIYLANKPYESDLCYRSGAAIYISGSF